MDSKRGMWGWAWVWVWVWVMVTRVVVKGCPQEDLISSLPGQPDSADTHFRQFSGYVSIANGSRHLFYYFTEAHLHHDNDEPSLHPLALWLNGGPGCSSIGGGAFTELGPFYPTYNGSSLQLTTNRHSWNKVANILFLECPAGVGFSYSDNTSDSYYDDNRVASDNLDFLLGWFEKFPQYKNSDFYLTGESYAGHYIPQLAVQILHYNEGSSDFKFKLQGVAIGNPLLNYGVDTAATYTFLWSHGLISDHTYVGINSTCNFTTGYPCTKTTTESSTSTSGGTAGALSSMEKDKDNECFCYSFLEQSNQEMGKHIDNYDVTLDVCVSSMKRRNELLMWSQNDIAEVDVCIDTEISKYLNMEEVLSALHVNLTVWSSGWKWEVCSSYVQYKFEDQLDDMVPVLKTLLKEGLRVWIFSGDQDSVVPLTGTRTQIDQLATSCNITSNSSYRAWYANDQVGGWTQSYGNLTYATVRGASHMVPYAQPVRALVLFTSFINGTELPYHKKSR